MMIRASTTQLLYDSIATGEYSFAGDQTQDHTGYATHRREGNAGGTSQRCQKQAVLIITGANTIPVRPTTSQTDKGSARKKTPLPCDRQRRFNESQYSLVADWLEIEFLAAQ